MNKIFSAIPLTILAGLLLTGCAGGDSTPSPSTEATPFQVQERAAQRIEGEQSEKLISELEKINPALTSERAVSRANRVCEAIVLGEPEESQIRLARTILMGPEMDPTAVSDENAKAIIEVLKTNNFCAPK